jgi:hypothetical protein
MAVSPDVCEPETDLVSTSARLIGHAAAELQRSLDGNPLLPIDCMDSASDYKCAGIGCIAAAPPLPFRAVFQV